MLGPVANMNIFSTAMAQGYDNYSDNYSYGQDMYSEYPTDENKYECQTGPFEGFFVSSVEFCKNMLNSTKMIEKITEIIK